MGWHASLTAPAALPPNAAAVPLPHSRRASMGGSLVRADLRADFAESFPYVHWIWQHVIARFEAGKLASGSLVGQDLAQAWRLHYDYGVVAHSQAEDRYIFPALKVLEGGLAAMSQLEAEHRKLDAKAAQIEKAFADGDERSLARARGLVADWAELYAAHIDLEEDLIIPLVRNVMPERAKKALSQELKVTMREAPGSKMVLCLFQDLASHPVLGAQYAASFPGFLRYVLIPGFARVDAQYREHKRLFGSLTNAL